MTMEYTRFRGMSATLMPAHARTWYGDDQGRKSQLTITDCNGFLKRRNLSLGHIFSKPDLAVGVLLGTHAEHQMRFNR